MVVLFARELARRGRIVSVYCSLKQFAITDVVYETGGHTIDYYRHEALSHHLHHGTLIAFKDPEALYLPGFRGKYLWTADRTHLDATQRKLCNGLFAISEWHERELKGVNIGYDRISCIKPGVLVDKSRQLPRIPKQCLYASSPDRGLDYLRTIWSEVLVAHPDATLIVTYDDDNRRTNEQMDDLYRQSDILAYPCNGQERYCLTAIKAQIYGTIPCIVPYMALQDTVQFGIKSLKDDYVDAIIKLLDDNSRDHLREDMVKNVKYNTWPDVVDQWEQIIGKEDQNKDKAE